MRKENPWMALFSLLGFLGFTEILGVTDISFFNYHPFYYFGWFDCYIKDYREEKGMTQAELGRKVGVRRETISRLEASKYNPSLVLAMQIAEMLDVTVEDMFKLKG